MSVREWADILTVPSLQARLQPDALDRQQSLKDELLEKLAARGKVGEHRRPQ